MYKVILADDEVLTRKAIAENTPWHDAGFELAGTAENGKDAAELADRLLPDLVITDICMPGMDGIALSGYLNQHYPDTKILILSGYDDFAYAKKAIEYGVSEYILKPVTSRELVEELKKIAEKLDRDREKKKYLLRISGAYEKSLPQLKEHFLNRLLGGKTSRQEAEAQLNAFGISQVFPDQSVVLIGRGEKADWEKRDPGISEELMDFIIFNIVQEIMGGEKNVLLFQTTANRCVLIFSADTEAALKEQIFACGTRIFNAIQDHVKISISVLVGKTVHSCYEWHDSYENAKYAEEFRYLLDAQDHFLYGSDFTLAVSRAPGIRTGVWSGKLIQLIRTGTREELENSVRDFFAALHEANCERQTMYLYIQNCVLSVLITLERREIVAEGEFEQVASFINHLSEYRYLSEIEGEFLKFCMEIRSSIDRKRKTASQEIADSAMEYIGKNYADPELTLNGICEYLSLSVSYFSMVFKACKHETFVEALTRIRMEKAKMLLETSALKTYEVAEKTGYLDAHYFGTIFKKQTGMTPMEYARRFRNGNPVT